MRHGYWAFRVFSQCQTGNTQHRCLFLNSAGISQDDPRIFHERHEVEISHRIRTENPMRGNRSISETETALVSLQGLQGTYRSRMYGKDKGAALGDRAQCANQSL